MQERKHALTDGVTLVQTDKLLESSEEAYVEELLDREQTLDDLLAQAIQLSRRDFIYAGAIVHRGRVLAVGALHYHWLSSDRISRPRIPASRQQEGDSLYDIWPRIKPRHLPSQFGIEVGATLEREPLTSSRAEEERVLFGGLVYRYNELVSLSTGAAFQRGGADPYFAVTISAQTILSSF